MSYEIRPCLIHNENYFDLYKDGEYVDTYIYECNAIAAVKKNQMKVAFIAFQRSHEGSSYLTYPMTSAMSGMGRKG